MDDRDRLTLLVDALRLVAAPFTVQVSVLPEFVHVPDEILNAIQFQLVPGLLCSKHLTEGQAAGFDSLEAFMDTLDWRPEWAEYPLALEAVQADPWWEELRSRARALLASLGEDDTPPTMEGIVYIRGSGDSST